MLHVDANMLLGLVGGALALIFDWFPWISVWFDGLVVGQKRLLVVGLCLLFGAAIYVGQLSGYIASDLATDIPGILVLLYDIVVLVGTSYAVHKATKP